MTAPKEELIKKLHAKGLCTAKGQPTTKLGWIHLDADQIVVLGGDYTGDPGRIAESFFAGGG